MKKVLNVGGNNRDISLPLQYKEFDQVLKIDKHPFPQSAGKWEQVFVSERF